MARNLEQLRKRYNVKASDGRRGRRRGPMARLGQEKGKPHNVGRTISRMLSYIKGFRGRFILVLLCMLFSTLSSLIGGYLLAPIIDKLTEAVAPGVQIQMSTFERIADGIVKSILGPKASEAYTYVIVATVILACVYFISAAASYMQARLMVSISQGVIAKLRRDLFVSLQRLPVRYFDSRPTGEIMSRFSNDVDNIDTMINNSLTSIISGVITVIGTLIFMFTTNVILSLIVIASVPVIIVLSTMIGKVSSKYYSSQQYALGAVNGYIEESVTGQKVIKVFNHESECIEEFDLLNEDLRQNQFKALFYSGAMGPIMGNTSQVAYGVVVGIGGIFMITGRLTPGTLTVFANYARQFAMPINMISQQMSTIFSALAGAERVFAVMDTDPETADAPDAESMDNLRGDVAINDVSFGYNDEKLVLKHISLYAHPGQKIAFVGSTGAGKTTVTNLLNRFYDVQEGSITIDGVDIRDIRRDELRKNIAVVLQDTHLFTGTVMENIRYGRLDATDEEVIRAAKTASAHSFISRLSDGYNTMIEGDGANLSQGQRQLLNIARAALSKAPILVLDEATSSVDTRTEKNIERGMDSLMDERTTFVIAHRLSTVRDADAIMVLEAGEIIERGNHDQLLELKGRYYELYTGVRELD